MACDGQPAQLVALDNLRAPYYAGQQVMLHGLSGDYAPYSDTMSTLLEYGGKQNLDINGHYTQSHARNMTVQGHL